MEEDVVGRDEQLRRVDRFVAGIPEHPGRLTIEGRPGIGKTTIWRAAVDIAFERGYRVLVCRPTALETSLAYSGIADLLAGVERSFLAELPEPQRRAIEIALLISSPTGGVPEPRTIFAAFGGALASVSRDQPVLVAIDDQQWIDKSSARALDYVGRRLGQAPVGILTTTRAGVGSSTHQPVADTEVLRLGPLSVGALHRLISARMGVSLPRPTALRLHRATEGNPFFALELARTLVVAGLPGASEQWPVPDELQDMVATRIAQLPKSVQLALMRAAASTQPTIRSLPATAVRAATRAEVVTVAEDGTVRFTHPLIATAVYNAASPEERRDVHTELAAAATDSEERARHRALACHGPDEEVAELLDQAAATAQTRGAPDVAAELQDRAAALTPRDRQTNVWARSVRAAEYYLRAGDLDRARALLNEAVTTPGEPMARSHALRLLAEACYRLRYLDEAKEHLREAVEANADPESTARAELDLTYVLLSSFGSFEAAHAAASDAVRAAESLKDNALLASARAALALTDQMLGGRLNEEMLSRALAFEDHEQPVPVEQRPSFIAGWALLMDEQLDRARSIFESLRERLTQRGADSDLPDLLGVMALLESLAGNLDRAAELAAEGYDLAQQAGSEPLAATTTAMRALVAAYSGDANETRTEAARAIELATESGWQSAAFWASSALAHLELALGNPEAVVATLTHSIALVETDGIGVPFRRLFLPDAIEALIRLNALTRADALTAQLEQCGRELDRGWAIVTGARCRALLLAAAGDAGTALVGLEQSLADAPALPMPIELARTLIVKGQLQRRRKQKRAARDSFQRALVLCEGAGAALWTEHARAELARTGAARGESELTPSETRVAELAVAGLTNREIATAAFMSQKTVEANLSRIYRKLGIRSRAELGLRLAADGRSSAHPGTR